MTITLEIPDSREKELREAASRYGQDLETFLLSLLDKAILRENTKPTVEEMFRLKDAGGIQSNVTTEQIIEAIH